MDEMIMLIWWIKSTGLWYQPMPQIWLYGVYIGISSIEQNTHTQKVARTKKKPYNKSASELYYASFFFAQIFPYIIKCMLNSKCWWIGGHKTFGLLLWFQSSQFQTSTIH